MTADDLIDDTPVGKDKIAYLRRIVSGNESHSVKEDARRLIEVALVRPRYFDDQFADFKKWRQTTHGKS